MDAANVIAIVFVGFVSAVIALHHWRVRVRPPFPVAEFGDRSVFLSREALDRLKEIQLRASQLSFDQECLAEECVEILAVREDDLLADMARAIVYHGVTVEAALQMMVEAKASLRSV